jgi:hypothetical protein
MKGQVCMGRNTTGTTPQVEIEAILTSMSAGGLLAI